MALTQVKRYLDNNISKIIFISVFALIFSSCNEKDSKIVHYEFEGIRVSRYDTDKKTYLYYGHCNNPIILTEKASAVVDWRFDDYIFTFLLFHKDGRVEIITAGGGKIEKLLPKSKFFEKDYETGEYFKLMENYRSIKGYRELFQMSDNLKLEKKRNEEFKSTVKVGYELEDDKMACP